MLRVVGSPGSNGRPHSGHRLLANPRREYPHAKQKALSMEGWGNVSPVGSAIYPPKIMTRGNHPTVFAPALRFARSSRRKVLNVGKPCSAQVQIIKAVLLLAGVTFMAFMVMANYGNMPLLQWHIKSTTKAQQGAVRVRRGEPPARLAAWRH